MILDLKKIFFVFFILIMTPIAHSTERKPSVTTSKPISDLHTTEAPLDFIYSLRGGEPGTQTQTLVISRKNNLIFGYLFEVNHTFKPQHQEVVIQLQTPLTQTQIETAITPILNGGMPTLFYEYTPSDAVFEEWELSLSSEKKSGRYLEPFPKELNTAREACHQLIQFIKQHGTPTADFHPVASSAEAIRIAVKTFISIYGADVMKNRSFTATLENQTWTVQGHREKITPGGDPSAEISSLSGKILKTSHGK